MQASTHTPRSRFSRRFVVDHGVRTRENVAEKRRCIRYFTGTKFGYTHQNSKVLKERHPLAVETRGRRSAKMDRPNVANEAVLL